MFGFNPKEPMFFCFPGVVFLANRGKTYLLLPDWSSSKRTVMGKVAKVYTKTTTEHSVVN